MADNVITMRRNGTTFTVVVKSADNAKLSFEDLMRKIITEAAVSLDPAADEDDLGIGFSDEEGG